MSRSASAIPEWPERSFLGRLRPETRSHIASTGTPRRYSAATILLHEGDSTSHTLVLWRGWTKVTAVGEGNRATLLAVRTGGEVVGDLAAITGEPRAATVTACGTVLAYALSAGQFEALLAAYPDAASALQLTLGDRLRSATRRRLELSGSNVRTRLVNLLAELDAAYGRESPHGRVIGIRFTQAEVAAAIGASEASVHKTLRDLRDMNLVSFRWGQISINRPEELEKLAHVPGP